MRTPSARRTREYRKGRAENQRRVGQKHESGIRKVTAKRKEIAAKVAALQAEDRTLRDEQYKLMKARDAAVEAARVKFREENA